MPCGIVLSPWKETLDQLIKHIFSFNKLYSLIYHFLHQNMLLFEGKSTSKEGQKLFMQLPACTSKLRRISG